VHQVGFLYTSFISLKIISSSFTISSPEFYSVQGYVTSRKKYVDFASNATTHLSYYSYTFQSTFTLPSCWCLPSQLYYQDMPRENNPKFYVLLTASWYNCVKKNQLDAQLILSIFCQSLHVSGISRPIIRR